MGGSIHDVHVHSCSKVRWFLTLVYLLFYVPLYIICVPSLYEN